jgi:hypothetical protein
MRERKTMSQEKNETMKTWGEETSPGVTEWQAEAPETQPHAAPMDDGEAVDDRSRLHKATILLLAACVLGIGAMYFIKMKKKPAVPTDQQKTLEMQVDLALQKLSNKDEQAKAKQTFRDSQEMIQLFYGYPGSQQVKLEELQRDPFIRETVKKAVVKDDSKQLAKLQKELEKKFASLKLQSVIQMSGGSKCLINGQIYGQGQTVGDGFTISTIHEKSVTLTSNDIEFELKM